MKINKYLEYDCIMINQSSDLHLIESDEPNNIERKKERKTKTK